MYLLGERLPARFATTAAVTSAASEAAARVLRLRARLIHDECAAAYLMAVQFRGGRLRGFLRGHFHERKAPRSPRRHVAHDVRRIDGTELSEQLLQLRLIGLLWQISDVQLPIHVLDSLRARSKHRPRSQKDADHSGNSPEWTIHSRLTVTQ